MNARRFDTLNFANKLKAAGMEPKLAEVQATALVEVMNDGGLATKPDIRELDTKLTGQIHELDAKLTGQIHELDTKFTGQIHELDTKLTAQMHELKSDLIKWMISLFITNITLVGGLIVFVQFVSHSAK